MRIWPEDLTLNTNSNTGNTSTAQMRAGIQNNSMAGARSVEVEQCCLEGMKRQQAHTGLFCVDPALHYTSHASVLCSRDTVRHSVCS
jgi:hypothetical protein